MSKHPLDNARHQSAIIGEDAVNLLVDLQISGAVEFFEPQEFRYLVWNKEEDQAFGVVRDDNGMLTLSFLVPHLGTYEVMKDDILAKASRAWNDFSRSMGL